MSLLKNKIDVLKNGINENLYFLSCTMKMGIFRYFYSQEKVILKGVSWVNHRRKKKKPKQIRKEAVQIKPIVEENH